MSRYSRPLHQSSRVRHFAAGVGGTLLLFTLIAASKVGISPMDAQEELSVAIDVRDVPCGEPYDDTVEVIPDTLKGKNRITVVVRNRECCCCGTESAYRIRSGQAPAKTDPKPDAPPAADSAEVASETFVAPPMGPPVASMGPVPLTTRALPVQPASAPAPVIQPTRRVPWWIALAAAPLALLSGDDQGECVDETGRNSGPNC